jgi:predicted transcriptional regulator
MPEEKILLLSIRQPYSRLILTGKKTFELRKRQPKINCKYALIYETFPTKAVIGYFEISRIHVKSIQQIWEISKQSAGISKTNFEKYYFNKQFGVAIEIKWSKFLDKPIMLEDLGVKTAPQDFMYLENEHITKLITEPIKT